MALSGSPGSNDTIVQGAVQTTEVCMTLEEAQLSDTNMALGSDPAPDVCVVLGCNMGQGLNTDHCSSWTRYALTSIPGLDVTLVLGGSEGLPDGYGPLLGAHYSDTSTVSDGCLDSVSTGP